ncbi:MAG: response regulator transcription factor [Kofleriaceae bacterium]|jgi:DNA-binding response OmpR family regulator|nr:response regulator transcription factor [Kofleriaceae bacterium]MBP9166951.1 response regulator transcription factor [Kofleriaceae bacterium]MBP9862441.1 response regulator transcription factor [Kofleriaceae bacterium]
MRVLVVDDEAEVRSVVARALRADGHAVTTAEDLESARERVAEGAELIVLDLRLPDGFGLELCRELRADGSTVPILLLTALSQVALRVEGLDAGADDFLGKPFAVAELRARVRALGRRGALPRGLTYRNDDLVLDVAGRHATRAGQEVAITAREWAILEILVRRAGRVVSRLDLLESVWGDASETAASSLEVLVGRLRRKLGSDLIRTLRGEGYALAEEPRRGQ